MDVVVAGRGFCTLLPNQTGVKAARLHQSLGGWDSLGSFTQRATLLTLLGLIDEAVFLFGVYNKTTY